MHGNIGCFQTMRHSDCAQELNSNNNINTKFRIKSSFKKKKERLQYTHCLSSFKIFNQLSIPKLPH